MVTIYSNPTAQEQRALVEVFDIDEHALASALDPEEISRLEFDEESGETFIVWTRPRWGQVTCQNIYASLRWVSSSVLIT